MSRELENKFLQAARLIGESFSGLDKTALEAATRLLMLRRRVLDALAGAFCARGEKLLLAARQAGCPLLEYAPDFCARDRLDELTLAMPQTPRFEPDVLFQHLTELELVGKKNLPQSWRIVPGRPARRAGGVFFTPRWLARRLAAWVTAEGKIRPRLVLDPACGSGRLLMEVARRLVKGDGPAAAREMRRLMGSHLRGVEVDPLLAALARTALWIEADPRLGPVDNLERAVIAADALLLSQPPADAVVANPPFEILTGFSRRPGICRYRRRLRQSGLGSSLRGPVALHWLFLERSLQVLAPGGRLAIILPASFLTDRSPENLRRLVLQQDWLRRVEHFEESRRVFTGVSQAVVWLAVEKRSERRRILLRASGLRASLEGRRIVGLDARRWPIPLVSAGLLKIADRLSRNNPLDFGSLAVGGVGEVDQTFYREFISDRPTGTLLVRGEHLAPYRTNLDTDCRRGRWLKRGGFEQARGGGRWREHVRRPRLAQTGIVNLQARRRLVAAPLPAGVFLGNSVNYWLPAENNGQPVVPGAGYLLALLNSLAYEWRFRLTSSNNNINLYEVQALPAIRLQRQKQTYPWRSVHERLLHLAAGNGPISWRLLQEALLVDGRPPARESWQVALLLNRLAGLRAAAGVRPQPGLDRLLDFLVAWHLGLSEADMAAMEKWLAMRFGRREK